MEDHIAELLGLVNKLTALGEELKDDLVAAMLLSSLPDSLSALITGLGRRSEQDLTLELVKGKLIDEYKRRKLTEKSDESNESVMKVSAKGYDSNKKKTCFFCKKNGHFKKECSKYKTWKSKREKANKVASDSRTTENSCFSVKVFKEKASKEVYEEACFSGKKIKGKQDAWIVDSGATSHMTHKREFFTEFDPTAKGYVLLADDKGCDILKDGVIKAKAVLTSELYELRTAEKVCAVKDSVRIDSENCQHSWHKRFGHRNSEAIKDLFEKGPATGITIKDCGKREICESCLKGKMIRKSFPKESKSKSQSILDLVHTLIDDYSRYTHVYLLENKWKVPAIIKDFIEMTKTQFQKKPKCIRSDRGGEYVNKDLQAYLKKEGIKIQNTVAYSPQQNGVAERKNRSLIEMARCMITDANLENKYWGKAVNTANYLQNRLPSKPINKTPFELWYSKVPNVEHLHIFGCEAFVHIPDTKRKKLDEKARKLIFVGYSEESKAFRLLDKETNKIQISRDVIFLDSLIKITEINKVYEDLSFLPAKSHKEEVEVTIKSNNEESEESSEEELISDTEEYETGSTGSGSEDHQDQEDPIGTWEP